MAGKPVVNRLVMDIAKVLGEPIEEMCHPKGQAHFFGDDVVASLEDLAEELGAKASIYRQLDLRLDMPLCVQSLH